LSSISHELASSHEILKFPNQ